MSKLPLCFAGAVFVFIFGLLVGAVAAPVVGINVHHALWEGDGVFTGGCSVWSAVNVNPGLQDGYRYHDFLVVGHKDDTGDELTLLYQRLDGMAFADGKRCGLSVDWSKLP